LQEMSRPRGARTTGAGLLMLLIVSRSADAWVVGVGNLDLPKKLEGRQK
jgi:hypothetical protein